MATITCGLVNKAAAGTGSDVGHKLSGEVIVVLGDSDDSRV